MDVHDQNTQQQENLKKTSSKRFVVRQTMSHLLHAFGVKSRKGVSEGLPTPYERGAIVQFDWLVAHKSKSDMTNLTIHA